MNIVNPYIQTEWTPAQISGNVLWIDSSNIDNISYTETTVGSCDYETSGTWSPDPGQFVDSNLTYDGSPYYIATDAFGAGNDAYLYKPSGAEWEIADVLGGSGASYKATNQYDISPDGDYSIFPPTGFSSVGGIIACTGGSTSYLVTEIVDASGNTNIKLVSQTGEEPETFVNTINGLNTITFDNVNNTSFITTDANGNPSNPFGTSGDLWDSIGFWYVFRPSADSETTQGTFIIQQPSTAANLQRILIHGPWANNQWIFDAGSINSPDLRVYSNTLTDAQEAHVISAYASKDYDTNVVEEDNIQYVKVDGNLYGSESSQLTPLQGRLGDYFIIGRSTVATHNQGGDMGEIIFTKDNLSEEDRAKIEGYLAHKWGLSNKLPASHPYKQSPPTI